MKQQLIDFFWRCFVRASTMPPPKFITRMERDFDPRPVKMPSLWQVMIAPVLILSVVALILLLTS